MNYFGGVPGGLWGTDSRGVASPQAGRPALDGGLQQLAMLQAFRNGTLNQAANPYTARPVQFLPQSLPAFDYAAHLAQTQAKKAQSTLQPSYLPLVSGGPGGDGSPGGVGTDGGADGSGGAGGGGAGGK